MKKDILTAIADHLNKSQIPAELFEYKYIDSITTYLIGDFPKHKLKVEIEIHDESIRIAQPYYTNKCDYIPISQPNMLDLIVKNINHRQKRHS